MTRLLTAVRGAIALVISLALLQATAMALPCTMNCDHMSPPQGVRAVAEPVTMHCHSRIGHAVQVGCSSNQPGATRSCCCPDMQPSALQTKVYQTNRDSFEAMEKEVCPVVSSGWPSSSCSSASPPNFLTQPTIQTLRI